ELLHGHRNIATLSFAQDLHRYRFPDLCVRYHTRQRAIVRHRLAVEGQHDVAVLHAGFCRGSTIGHTRDPRATRPVHAHALGARLRDLLNAHAKPAADDLAAPKLVDDALRRIGWNRKTDADRATTRRVDRRIDADHVAIHVEQRAAGIAAIDWS